MYIQPLNFTILIKLDIFKTFTVYSINHGIQIRPSIINMQVFYFILIVMIIIIIIIFIIIIVIIIIIVSIRMFLGSVFGALDIRVIPA
jgi:hypothetical protein